MNNFLPSFASTYLLAILWFNWCENNRVEGLPKYVVGILGGFILYGTLMSWSSKPDTEEDQSPNNEE